MLVKAIENGGETWFDDFPESRSVTVVVGVMRRKRVLVARSPPPALILVPPDVASHVG
jgi:hypothetical protein